MQRINRITGDENPLEFSISLEGYGRTTADIDDIFFSLKKEKSDADDAYFLKSKNEGGISIIITPDSDENFVALVDWSADDYVDLKPDRYLAGIFVKFTGATHADENVNTIFELILEEDYLRA